MQNRFELIQREACQASIMLEGLTGRGKSGLALMLSYGLLGGFAKQNTPEEQAEIWKQVYAIDAENNSLKLFAGIPASWGENFGRFYALSLTPEDGFQPSNYLNAREQAIACGAKVCIADSVTHMWTAKGGILDMVSEAKDKDPRMDNYRVWGLPGIRDEKQKLVDVIRDHRCHMITTVRVKEKHEMKYNEDKKMNEVVSLGEQQVQQEGLKYEPDLVLSMIKAGRSDGKNHPIAKVLKSRYAILNEGEEYEFTPDLVEQLRQYLSEGTDPKELLEAQRKDYVAAIKNILDTNSSAKAIWSVLKSDAGHATTKLDDIPLDVLKRLYSQISV